MANGEPIWIEIPADLELPVGSHIHVRCEWKTAWEYGRAAQWALIEERLSRKHPQWEIISYTNNPEYLFIEAKVIEPAEPTAEVQTATAQALLVALGIIGVSILGSWAFWSYSVYLDTQRQAEVTKQRETELEIVKAGGEIPQPAPAGAAAAIQQSGVASWKIAAAIVAVLIVAKWAR